MNGRAALEAARTAFAPSRGRTPHETDSSPVYEPLDPHLTTVSGRALAMWSATEQALQVATERNELSGQALIAEARRLNRLTLGDAHALINLQGWVERVTQAPDNAAAVAPPADARPDEQERLIASEAFMAIEHALREHSAPLATSTPVNAPQTSASPTSASQTSISTTSAPPTTSPPPTTAYRVPPRTPPAHASVDASPAAHSRRAPRRGWLAALTVAIVIAAAAGGWTLWQRRGLADYRAGVAAFESGNRSAARAALARAAQRRPRDARPFMLLGRLAREQQDYKQARRYLQAAVRIDPTNALASRELASALLADGEPELARRFYVYAIERDPTDRVAQGFLGCTLLRLGRPDLAATWFTRAGAGEWSRCAAPTPSAAPASTP